MRCGLCCVLVLFGRSGKAFGSGELNCNASSALTGADFGRLELVLPWLRLFTLRNLAVCACVAMGVAGVILLVWPYLPGGHGDAQAQRPPRVFDFSERALQQRLTGFDPAMATLARRFDRTGPTRLVSADQVSPPPPFASDDLAPLTPAEAVRANAAVPVDSRFNRPAAPFTLGVMSAQDADRALDCLTAAVYYESAYETPAGQAAVAQVVLNRVRHPAFPKTVCAVVLQGSERRTGCQFTFTCDGALMTPPHPAVWLRARAVASAALAGKVEKSVGHATHYHTVWVRPYWAPSLTKVNVIGAHIFYRWAGGLGLSGAFNGRYQGEAANSAGLVALYKALHKPLAPDSGLAEAVAPAVLGEALAQTAPPPVINASVVAGAPAQATPSAGPTPGPGPAAKPGPTVTVLGEVEKPGDYPWREGMKVDDAVTLAGGYTYRAKKSTVYLQKKDQAEPTKQSAKELTLTPGDRIKVAERFF